jgi:hypothetical protein
MIDPWERYYWQSAQANIANAKQVRSVGQTLRSQGGDYCRWFDEALEIRAYVRVAMEYRARAKSFAAKLKGMKRG